MNPVLVIIVIALVVIIGYILSRPFENPPTYKVNTSEKNDLRDQYDSLLREIKVLQNSIETDDNPNDLKKQIELKKRHAARLLRQINPDLKS